MFVNGYIANGQLTKEYLISQGVKPENIFTGGMCADSKGLSERASRVSAQEKEGFKLQLIGEQTKGLVYIYVGRIIELKGVNYLLEAWNKHICEYPDDKLLIVGGGPLLDEYKNRYADSSIIYTGEIDYSAIYKYYAISDVFIIPTLEDNWSLVVPEAMACGLPIACSIYNGCHPELVKKDENGITFDPLNKDSVIETLDYIQTGGGRRRGIPVGNEASFIREDTAGIGALGDIGCYSLDMVLRAVGYPKPLTVTGYKSDFFGKREDYYTHRGYSKHAAQLFGVDDFAAAFVRLEGGIVLDFRIAWAMNIDSPGDTIILGTKGGLRIPATDCWNGSVGGPMTLYHEVAGEQIETVIPTIPFKGYPALWDGKIRSFLDAVKNGGESPVPSREILYNQAIIDGIAKSHALGREIEIEIPEV